ncbi:MAG: GNAT family N-acetyltransferase [Rhodoferax sp.]
MNTSNTPFAVDGLTPIAEQNPEVRRYDTVVPIRSLGENHRGRIERHLCALDARDRYLRFGYAASDEAIRQYVEALDFDNDEIFGIYNRNLELIATAHLAYSLDRGVHASAEFGVSVLPKARGRGYGTRLFERAMMHARNQNIRKLYVHVLAENQAMLAIARNAGATIECDGHEAQGCLLLPPPTLDTRLAEIVEEHTAQINYRIKEQGRQLRDALDQWQRLWRVTTSRAD